VGSRLSDFVNGSGPLNAAMSGRYTPWTQVKLVRVSKRASWRGKRGCTCRSVVFVMEAGGTGPCPLGTEPFRGLDPRLVDPVLAGDDQSAGHLSRRWRSRGRKGNRRLFGERSPPQPGPPAARLERLEGYSLARFSLLSSSEMVELKTASKPETPSAGRARHISELLVEVQLRDAVPTPGRGAGPDRLVLWPNHPAASMWAVHVEPSARLAGSGTDVAAAGSGSRPAGAPAKLMSSPERSGWGWRVLLRCFWNLAQAGTAPSRCRDRVVRRSPSDGWRPQAPGYHPALLGEPVATHGEDGDGEMMAISIATPRSRLPAVGRPHWNPRQLGVEHHARLGDGRYGLTPVLVHGR